nr:immunoglobulin light chain junction region [Macaca mulatta]
CLLYFIGVRVF